ncbi:MAG TPA: hypothetical protein VHW02_06685 [Rhizomicrobium sp.]|jgi:tetratricopeptide (TPR) repeat protein|nr:hypothetical protein [Rhizomicrobium sp.]
MSDELGEGGQPPAAEAVALHAALGTDGASEEAREYLRKQSRLADLQIDTLEKKDEFELSHLRFRRFSDYARFALEIAGGLVVLLIVCGLGSMVWSATQDRGLVVDVFSVPPDLAQTGLTGSVVANRLIDRYGALQANSFAVTQGGESYRRDSSGDVRVEIPDTGVSLGELQRYLRDWLGNDARVSGEVVHAPKGYSLTVRYGSQPGFTVQGSDLDKLMNQSAEKLMAAALPYRYVEYLSRHHRVAEAVAILPALSASGSTSDRGRAYSAWATLYFYQGQMLQSRKKALEGLTVDPHNAVLEAYAGVGEGNLGHDEGMLDYAKATLADFNGDAAGGLDPNVVIGLPALFTIYVREASGDLTSALAGWARLEELGTAYDPAQNTADAAADHNIELARRTFEKNPKTFQGSQNFNLRLGSMLIAYYSGNWPSAVRNGAEAAALLQKQPDQRWQQTVYDLPYWADAAAHTGDIKGAEALIAPTPLDCDACVRSRGRIAAQKRDWKAAAHWFALVSARAPHVPFADTDWGAMLLAKGDLDGAIAQFESANAKGPHFADPLEMWGEALMAKNRSDLALAKFDDANKYAPNWGRLHLKWGEALSYAGDKADAQKQWAIAAHLDLAPPEKSQLVRLSHGR